MKLKSGGEGSMFNRRSAPLVALGAAVLLAASACSSSGSSSTGSASASPVTTTPSTATPSTATGSAAATGTAAPATCGTAVAPTVSGSGPADPATAGKQVAANFQKFFDPATTTAGKLALLQSGAQFAPLVRGFAGNALAGRASATVLTVDFTSASAAHVTFNLCQSGTPALPGAVGMSVLQGGVWKVADSTLCNLIKLNNSGSALPGCP
ncbi:hypothetical protein GXW83_21280 [Streptacidiphilus sp. PB12-B1b]|uniref:hypothetical protein n=1 Tax=Streptacidiphilus sp. PB12-B1b TaxID=2705012 RepID=UPI0015FA2F08|nr:hypothetical protein [Streptacidiphilus sp. PB12-B1b]QMU77845.1 hypothetical protein GXW83_21280 [Streptacidiphilus sp. PB12-B1b]